MSNYTPLVSFETEFEDDTVTMKLDQLSRKVFLSWLPYMGKMDDEGKLNEENTMKLVGEASSLLPDYVTEFKGLKDADGNAVDIKTVVEKIYFIELVSAIVVQLIEMAQIGKGIEETKEQVEEKSVGPQLASSKV